MQRSTDRNSTTPEARRLPRKKTEQFFQHLYQDVFHHYDIQYIFCEIRSYFFLLMLMRISNTLKNKSGRIIPKIFYLYFNILGGCINIINRIGFCFYLSTLLRTKKYKWRTYCHNRILYLSTEELGSKRATHDKLKILEHSLNAIQ